MFKGARTSAGAHSRRSYANSILQCLYYSVPFREQVMSYPSRSPVESVVMGPDGQPRLKIRPPMTAEQLSPNKSKPGQVNAARAGVSGTGQRPDDKDSQEYKKKQLLAKGPIYNMDYDNATTYGMSESLFTSLKDLFEAIVASQKRMGVISPQKLIEVLKRDNEIFRGNVHQDAHEFLNMLLNQVVDVVEENVKKLEQSRNAGVSAQDMSLSTAYEKVASHAQVAKVSEDIRWVHELFQGTLTSETKCLTCENVSQRDEPFLDLSVDLEAHASVTSCLRKFSEEEMLRERDKFFCDNCGGLQEAEKRMKIKRSPKILALHLKRFRYTEDLQRLQKLFHRVVYPYHLRLFNTTADAEDPDRLYELYAVVVHIGIGPYHGHYVSIVKTQDRGWLLFDDELVEPVDKAFVLNFFGDRANLACAYVLFYRETTLEAVKQEQEAEGRAAAAKYAASAAPAKESHGFGLGLTLKTNGITNSQAQTTSADDETASTTPLLSLDHVATAPPTSSSPLSPSNMPTQPVAFSSPLGQSQTIAASAPEINSPQSPRAAAPLSKKERAKEEKERKAEEKEKEKERKAAEKEAAKQAKAAKKEEDARAKAAAKTHVSPGKVEPTYHAPQKQSSSDSATTAPPSIPASSAATAASTYTVPSTFTAPTSVASPEPIPSSPANGHAHSASHGSGSAFNRFRQSSKSLKARPKFWGGSGPSPAAVATAAAPPPPAAPPVAATGTGTTGTGVTSNGSSKDDTSAIEDGEAHEMEKGEGKPEGKENQRKLSRFSLRRKGSGMWS